MLPNLLTIVAYKVSEAYINRGYNCYIVVSAQVVYEFSSLSLTI
jgi:hypothetical protein